MVKTRKLFRQIKLEMRSSFVESGKRKKKKWERPVKQERSKNICGSEKVGKMNEIIHK